ncbi:hypothetical protein NGM37_27070, partial [Streptomyces sp. TRM76130]|nr:hypothetical protein [Streptomyces sp. TRM76130]
ASSAAELEALLGEEFADRPAFETDATAGTDEPYTVIVVDCGQVPSGHRLGRHGFRNAVVLDLSGELPWRPGRTTLRLQAESGEVRLAR